ncbi:hypothetical protein PoB_000711000 [Plakobranchus ocellatus]|uniref:Mos1 transposase HTH domain-containing protein n=1 Tax=Plakobranchus ocellatus TaxID=259542 RepID=A0AAV3YDJ6_9GAST|nr:hypothetical protein PoB_000711000 [Plakobranchus ocellatus]
MIAQEIKESFTCNDIRVAIFFFILLGKSAIEIQSDLITEVEDLAPSSQTTRKWMRTISERHFDISENSGSERPLTAWADAGITAVQQSLPVDRQKMC